MEINRSNYEIWLIDWLDGNLNDCQAEQLQLFLNQNPDLEEEFTELNLLILKPSKNSFTQKDQLIKSISDLSGPQFDYLCIACHENDLDSEQKTELMEIIDRDHEMKSRYDLLQRIKLTPQTVSYKNKKKLIKTTAAQKIIRSSIIGISAAATVALLIVSFFLIPPTLPDKINKTALNIYTDGTLLKQAVSPVTDKSVSIQKPVVGSQNDGSLISLAQKEKSEITESVTTLQSPKDSLFRDNNQEIMVVKIPASSEIDLNEKNMSNKLVASKAFLITPQSEDEQSKLSKFIARTFREKILKEPASKDSPLKAYEIAEAGVSGLNKLLGWEMALDEKKDENGELASVYFSSKILKFNAPVKKDETVP
jgi:hypothetical protein